MGGSGHPAHLPANALVAAVPGATPPGAGANRQGRAGNADTVMAWQDKIPEKHDAKKQIA